jgi:hypothetical protein
MQRVQLDRMQHPATPPSNTTQAWARSRHRQANTRQQQHAIQLMSTAFMAPPCPAHRTSSRCRDPLIQVTHGLHVSSESAPNLQQMDHTGGANMPLRLHCGGGDAPFSCSRGDAPRSEVQNQQVTDLVLRQATPLTAGQRLTQNSVNVMTDKN